MVLLCVLVVKFMWFILWLMCVFFLLYRCRCVVGIVVIVFYGGVMVLVVVLLGNYMLLRMFSIVVGECWCGLLSGMCVIVCICCLNWFVVYVLIVQWLELCGCGVILFVMNELFFSMKNLMYSMLMQLSVLVIWIVVCCVFLMWVVLVVGVGMIVSVRMLL